MIQPYSQALLQQHFPSYRDPPPPGVFELAIACCGGTSAGPYVAGVLDFIWEAFEDWRAAAHAGQAPDHKVIVRNMVGASAGGLSLGLATIATLKQYPHAYDDRLWATYHQADPAHVPAVQPKTDNPHYLAWVSQITLDRLLSHPEEVATGQVYLFHGAPAEICDKILTDACTRPDATGREFVYSPLEFRATIGNLKGVPYALDYNTLGAAMAQVTDQWFEAHRDNIGFAADTAPMGGTVDLAANGVTQGPLGPAPDTHDLTAADLCPTPGGSAHDLFRAAMISTSAIPLVFEVKTVPEDPSAYDWRAGYWDRDRNNGAGHAVIDRPAWIPPQPDRPYNYAATDGGLFDNRPFDVAHNRLAGPRGQNPQSGMDASRAIIMVDPLADDAEPAPWDPNAPEDPAKPGGSKNNSLFGMIKRLVLSPVMQDRMDALDLAQIKDESIYSRFLIAPSRSNPTDPTKGWTPSQSLLGAPFDAFLGFAAEAYREHDFLLGRRNAQQFLRESFALPANHPLFAGRGGWTAAELAMTDGHGVPHRPLIPLRGRAADEQPAPVWAWQALSDDDIDRYRTLAGKRADAIFKNLTRSLGWFANGLVKAAWALYGRGKVLDAFADGLTSARAGLNPASQGRTQ